MEGTDGPSRCSTESNSTELGTSRKASSPPPCLSGSGEVEEERDVVQDVVEDEEWGEVSDEEAGGWKDEWWSDCGSDNSSPPADMEAADIGPEAAIPVDAVPVLYSWYNRFLSFSSKVFMRLSTNSILGGPSLSDSATEEG